MDVIILAALTVLLYLLAAVWLGYGFLTAGGSGIRGDSRPLMLGGPALVLHAILLYRLVYTDAGLNMGFYNSLSLVGWVISLVVVLISLARPAFNLAMVILPMTALCVLSTMLFPGERLITDIQSFGLDIHIILSIGAYSLLAIAALQAILLAVQEHQLRTRHPVHIIRFLPPMQTMEDLLVQLLWVGYFLLSLGLVTGMMFVQDVFAQHLVHKTVLTILAWLFFSLVLFGRWAWGWRGRKLVNWTLWGFALLMLGYFGSKFVLELVLNRV